MTKIGIAAVTMAFASLAACSGGEDDGGEGADSQSAIAVLTRVCGPDNCQHYLNTFGTLPADKKIDRGKGAESGNTQGMVFNGAIYIFDRDESSVTRWTVAPDLRLQKGATVSFQAAGVKDACAICNVFGTPTRAHMVDSTAGVIVTWDPTAMEIVSTQDLPPTILGRDGLPAQFVWPFVSGGRAFMAASWIDYDTLKVYPKAAVVTFDAAADRPALAVIEDERCGVSSVMTPFADAQGNVYVAGDWFSGLKHIGSLEAPAPNPSCLLRIEPGATTFDPAYYLDLLAKTNASGIAGAYAIAGGKVLVNYYPKEAAPPTRAEIEADPWAYYSKLVFRYAVLDLGSGTSKVVEAIEPGGSGNNTPLVMDGVNYIQTYPKGQFTEEDPGADLFAIRPDGTAEKVLSAGTSGDFEMVGRVR